MKKAKRAIKEFHSLTEDQIQIERGEAHGKNTEAKIPKLIESEEKLAKRDLDVAGY